MRNEGEFAISDFCKGNGLPKTIIWSEIKINLVSLLSVLSSFSFFGIQEFHEAGGVF
jgi:hypothetical protein